MQKRVKLGPAISFIDELTEENQHALNKRVLREEEEMDKALNVHHTGGGRGRKRPPPEPASRRTQLADPTKGIAECLEITPDKLAEIDRMSAQFRADVTPIIEQLPPAMIGAMYNGCMLGPQLAPDIPKSISAQADGVVRTYWGASNSSILHYGAAQYLLDQHFTGPGQILDGIPPGIFLTVIHPFLLPVEPPVASGDIPGQKSQ